ncbi:MAG TPA: type II CRISPR-associated endonuclease Cas1 [Bacteroidales bacterium]|nr:type II CRISPR-associated endonuclease Cas1 [Bacteroidales bacterium]
MIKRTVAFENAARLKLVNGQLNIEPEGSDARPVQIPVEDIGVLIIESAQVTLTHALLQALMDNNVVVISCNARHLPYGLMLPMFQHHAFTEKMYAQLESSLPLRKNLWQQTVRAKIMNQASLLEFFGHEAQALRYLASSVKSGDTGNLEGRAAAIYWKMLTGLPEFTRDREGEMPNAMFNYAYGILLATVARSLVASGLLPAMGIHHRNKYNPWCLASDVMEPYRPMVDHLVITTWQEIPKEEKLNTRIKRKLLQVPVIDVVIDGQRSPLMVAVQRTTASLTACFEGLSRKILYPEFVS